MRGTALLAPTLVVASLLRRAVPEGDTKFDNDAFFKGGEYVPASEMGKMYHQVVSALFKVSCQNQLAHAKETYDTMPESELDAWCSQWYAGLDDGDASLRECEGVVDELKTEFEKEPGEFSAEGFCTTMWDMMVADTQEELAANKADAAAREAAAEAEAEEE